MYRKCVTVQPCQVENNHTTGIKMKTFIYCFILVMCSSVHTKSSVQTGTQNKESWIVSLQLIRADTTTGNKVLGLKSPYQLDPFKSRSSSPVCERNFVTNMGLRLLCSVKHRTCLVPSWKLLLGTGQGSLCQVTLSTEKQRHLGGFNLKADLCVFYIYLILIWR